MYRPVLRDQVDTAADGVSRVPRAVWLAPEQHITAAAADVPEQGAQQSRTAAPGQTHQPDDFVGIQAEADVGQFAADLQGANRHDGITVTTVLLSTPRLVHMDLAVTEHGPDEARYGCLGGRAG